MLAAVVAVVVGEPLRPKPAGGWRARRRVLVLVRVAFSRTWLLAVGAMRRDDMVRRAGLVGAGLGLRRRTFCRRGCCGSSLFRLGDGESLMNPFQESVCDPRWIDWGLGGGIYVSDGSAVMHSSVRDVMSVGAHFARRTPRCHLIDDVRYPEKRQQ